MDVCASEVGMSDYRSVAMGLDLTSARDTVCVLVYQSFSYHYLTSARGKACVFVSQSSSYQYT